MAGSNMETELIDAARRGDMALVRSLIDAGAKLENKETSGLTALMHASQQGHDEVVQSLLKAGANVNLRVLERYNTTVTALILASLLMPDLQQNNFLHDEKAAPACLRVLNNKTKILKMLLEAGADPNIQDTQGRSALIHLTDSKLSDLYLHSSVSGTLVVSHGHKNEAKISAVYEALIDRCRLLLQYKADVNLQDDRGMTALMHAAKNKLPRCLEVLLTHNANVNLGDNLGKTALMHCAHLSTKCLGLLLRHGAHLNQQDKSGKTALMYAACTEKCVTFLVKHGADINVRSHDGHTAVLFPAMYGYPECFKLLISLGADVNVKTVDGETALMLAAEEGKLYGHGLKYPKWPDDKEDYIKNEFIECCELLIGPDTDIHLEDYNKKTALMHAIEYDASNCLAFLIEKGADVVFQNSNGTTPLMFAIQCDAERCFGFLCQDGQDFDLQDKEGKTALMYAIEIVPKWRDQFNLAGGDPEIAYRQKWAATYCKPLLEKGASVNSEDNKGRTALMYLIQTLAPLPYCDPDLDTTEVDDTYFCTRLIERGADVNHQDKEGRTALMHAIISCSRGEDDEDDDLSWTYCNCLISAGANLNLEDSHGRTALMYAIIHNTHGSRELILQNNSDQDKKG